MLHSSYRLESRSYAHIHYIWFCSVPKLTFDSPVSDIIETIDVNVYHCWFWRVLQNDTSTSRQTGILELKQQVSCGWSRNSSKRIKRSACITPKQNHNSPEPTASSHFHMVISSSAVDQQSTFLLACLYGKVWIIIHNVLLMRSSKQLGNLTQYFCSPVV